MKWRFAFDRAGFDAIDVHMSDLQQQRHHLKDFQALVACGGFSYGDVLGAGGGWAKSILFNTALRDQFATFFERENTLALGVCNGCQMLANLAEIIQEQKPGHVLCVTNQNVLKHAQRWFASMIQRLYGLTEWQDLICQSRFRTERGGSNLKTITSLSNSANKI